MNKADLLLGLLKPEHETRYQAGMYFIDNG